jgi:predicted transposase YbfD/YdcC
MGCQKDIAEKIIDKDANYILALKGNQENLQQQVLDSFRFLPPVSISGETDAGHGRVEIRRCSAIEDLSMIKHNEKWKNLKSLVKIESERYFKATGKTERETRFYISSLIADATLLN